MSTNPNVAGTTANAQAAPAAAQDAAPVKKVVRRGISNETRGTTRLTFSHKDAKQNGLFLAHIESVEVSMMRVGEDKSGMPSFAGCEVPKLTIRFTSNEEDVNARRWVSLQFNAVESNVNTIPNGKEEWKINLIFDWLKHLLNVFVLKGRPMTETEEAALSLAYQDFDENGDYINVAPEVVLESWKQLFENFANIMNTGRDGNPVYKSSDGKPIVVWIKLLRYIKQRTKGWQPIANGNLAFPQFVGEGCVEIFKTNTIPVIRIEASKETILPMKVEKAKSPTQMPGAPVGGAMYGGGIEVPNSMTGMVGAGTTDFLGDDDDLPFGE